MRVVASAQPSSGIEPQEYEADRHKRLGAEADQPHRIRFKPLAK